MKKIFSLFVIALFSVSMFAAEATAKFYFAIPSATLGENTVKFNTKFGGGDSEWSGEQTMSLVEGKTYQGRLVYSLEYTFPYGGYHNWQFMNGSPLYVETYAGDWNTDIHDGQMYLYDTKTWVAYDDDPSVSIEASKTSGAYIDETITITATAEYGTPSDYTFYENDVKKQEGSSNEFAYIPTSKGDKTIKVVVTCDNGTKEASVDINVAYEKWDIYVENNCSWGNMKLYLFGDATPVAWPGADCEPYTVTGSWYKVTLDDQYGKFIVNNGAKEQTFDNTLSKENQPANTTWQFVYDHEYNGTKYYNFTRSYVVSFGIGEVAGTEGTISTAPAITTGDYVAQGTEITFTRPDAKSEYQFKGWYSNAAGTGDALGTNDTYQVTLGAAISVYAVYEYEGGGTALDNTADEAKAVKRIVNGQLVIEREGKLFNALGAEVK